MKNLFNLKEKNFLKKIKSGILDWPLQAIPKSFSQILQKYGPWILMGVI